LALKRGVIKVNTEELLSIVDFKKGDGLIPAVIQDYKNGEVLMMAYMNKESLEKTISSGTTWFWSRSRNEFWNKGATSGHYQKVKNILIDCDGDTLLIKVEQVGAACHTGERTCFYREIEINSNP
jgi:phosphoribosyl-AMP cyclohydrolase